MKQHITVEQLDELTPEAINKLEHWCFINKHFVKETTPFFGPPARFTDTKTGTHYIIDPPLLSIGQMIEFLDEENGEFWEIYRQVHFDDIGLSSYDYIVDFGKIKNSANLCDALWEAVKEVLVN